MWPQRVPSRRSRALLARMAVRSVASLLLPRITITIETSAKVSSCRGMLMWQTNRESSNSTSLWDWGSCKISSKGSASAMLRTADLPRCWTSRSSTWTTNSLSKLMRFRHSKTFRASSSSRSKWRHRKVQSSRKFPRLNLWIALPLPYLRAQVATLLNFSSSLTQAQLIFQLS